MLPGFLRFSRLQAGVLTTQSSRVGLNRNRCSIAKPSDAGISTATLDARYRRSHCEPVAHTINGGRLSARCPRTHWLCSLRREELMAKQPLTRCFTRCLCAVACRSAKCGIKPGPIVSTSARWEVLAETSCNRHQASLHPNLTHSSCSK